MLTGWLVRLGLGWVLPWLIPTFIGLLLSGGFAANLWWQWFHLYDIVLITVGVVLLYLYALAKYEWAKLGYVLIMIGDGYVAGRFHEHDLQLALQRPRIEAARLEVHKQYKNKRDAEIERLEAVNKELRDKAKTAEVVHMDERAKLRKERDDAIEAAKKLPGADDVIYTPDDIDVLNRLRHDRRRFSIQGGR